MTHCRILNFDSTKVWINLMPYRFLKKNFKTIFESELDSWMTDPGVWPKKRTFKLFKEWFDIQVSDMIFDLAKDDVTTEE